MKIIDADYRLVDQWELQRMLGNLQHTEPGPEWTEWQRSTLATDTEECLRAQIAASSGKEVYVALDDDGYWFATGFNPSGWAAKLDRWLEQTPRDLVRDDNPIFYIQEPSAYADQDINLCSDLIADLWNLLGLEGTGVDPEVEFFQVAAPGGDCWEIRIRLSRGQESLWSGEEPFRFADYATNEQRDRYQDARLSVGEEGLQ